MPPKNSSKSSKPLSEVKNESPKNGLGGDDSSSDERFDRPPESSDEEVDAPPPIKASTFKNSQGNKSPSKSTVRTTAKGKNGGGHNIKISTREDTLSPTASTGSQKRKSQEDVDMFGRIVSKNPKPTAKRMYGSQHGQGTKKSSQRTSTQGSKASPVKELQIPKNIGSSPGVDSPLKRGLKTYGSLSPSSAESTPAKPDFIKNVDEGLDTPEKTPAFKSYELDSDLEDGGSSLPRRPALEETPATQFAEFKAHDLSALSQVSDLPEGILDKVAIFGSSDRAPSRLKFTVIDGDDDSFTKTQKPCCPMCNEPVDAADLKAKGFMNTRQQEMFCRMHRKKSATKDWVAKGYPEIDWGQLDGRVSKHHAFIRKIIKGADSHYRAILQDKVDQGKDRNFRKMTSNLTPGYYGSRGLRTISENIMAKFTPLLKKQIVLDPLMSARGFTPFVQSVIVPEVTVLLIREDMDVDVEEARTILVDSAMLGELLNEELREIVTRQVDDSEDDDDEEEE